MDSFSRILEKKGGGLLCTPLYLVVSTSPHLVRLLNSTIPWKAKIRTIRVPPVCDIPSNTEIKISLILITFRQGNSFVLSPA